MSDVRVESLRDIDLKSDVGQYVTHCPNCQRLGKRNDDYKLSISVEKNVFHCYRCNWSGRVDQLLNGYVDKGSLLRYRMNSIDNSIKYKSSGGTLIQTELIDFNNISFPIDKSFINAVEYLRKRNMTFEEIKKYDIRIGKDRYRGRIVIPTYDLNGNVVYVTARDYVNKDPESKYINPPGSHKSFAVWNIQEVKNNSIVIITEGVFSGIAANRNTPESVTAVSVFGKVLSDSQAKLISSKEPKEVVLGFDGDVSQHEISNNYQLLRKYYQGKISVIQLMDGEDPDNINGELYTERFEKRQFYNRFVFKPFKNNNKI